MNTRPLILYHHDVDGFVAALCYYLVLRDQADYQPVQHHKETSLPDVTGRPVAILDFSYDRKTTEHLYQETGGNLLVLDHHVTALEELKGLPYCQVDVTKSGAMLAFQHMLPELKTMAERKKNGVTHPMIFRLEKIVAMVDDRDRWANKIRDSDAANLAFESYDRDFRFWFHVVLQQNLRNTVQDGHTMLLYRNFLLERLVGNKQEGIIDGHECLVVNTPVLQSETGHSLVHNNVIAVLWCKVEEGKYIYSLRSAETGPDVSVLAKQHGGGGHYHAAGFYSTQPPDELINFINS